MYIPNKLIMNALSEKHKFIQEFGFGVIVSDSLDATHLPFVLKPEQGTMGVLYTHCAKANPHWKSLNNTQVLIVFSGPHSYISPSWYASSPAVPTWNYTAVHAYGSVSLLNAEETLMAVEDMVNQYEPELQIKRDILTKDYRDKLLSGIVGIKIELTDIQGKLKLGQQRSQADQQGVYHALSHSDNVDNIVLAKYMKKRNIGLGS